jgi:hypothetical protein
MRIKFQLGILKGRDHLGDLRRKWKNNIKMGLREKVCECVD